MFGSRNWPWCARTAQNCRLRAGLASTAMDGGRAENAGAIFGQPRRLWRSLRRSGSLLRGLPRGSHGCCLGAQLLLDLELLELGREDVLLRPAPVLVVGITRAGRDQP